MNTKPIICTDYGVAGHFKIWFGVAQCAAYQINVANGWWDNRNAIIHSSIPGSTELVMIGCLGLVHSEVSEAIEAVRKHDSITWEDAKTKDTLVRELAGTVVRCMDLAERFNLPLAEAIVEEIKANAERGYKHGGKAA